MEKQDLSIFSASSKSKSYIENKTRHTFNFLEPSIKYPLERADLKNSSILDVGCASGDMFSSLNEKFDEVEYLGIDIDEKCIDSATTKYPEATFEAMDFMSNSYKDESFDTVMMWSWWYMAPNWKEILIEACRLSRKYVLFDTRLRLAGPTVIDIDLSYQYYHRSGRRNHYILHNLYTLLAFFHIDYLHIKKVTGYGYPFPGKTTAFLPLPTSEAFLGGFCLERYPIDERDFVRIGVQSKNTTPYVELDINIPGYRK